MVDFMTPKTLLLLLQAYRYGDMPENHTFLGGSGLIIPKEAPHGANRRGKNKPKKNSLFWVAVKGAVDLWTFHCFDLVF